MFQHVAAKALLPKAALLIWSAAGPREEHRLRVFENRVLRKIFGPKRDDRRLEAAA
jgi:hypothetical protein